MRGRSVYLDTSAIKRPFDDQSSSTVQAETQAVLSIVDAVESGTVILVSSDVLEFENARNPDPQRRRRAARTLGLAASSPGLGTPGALARAREIEGLGFRPLDAAHLAVAESARVDAFVTADARLLRVARRRRADLQVVVLSPTDFIGGAAS